MIGKPIIGEIADGYTQTFIGIGAFDKKEYANNCLRYIKSKFVRTLLAALKASQSNHVNTWKYVPLQDFTEHSDINWSNDIDKELYKKYSLTEEEILFIETHIKEMV